VQKLFSSFDLILLMGILQGIIYSALLLTNKKNPVPNRFLALGLLALSFLSTKPLLHTLQLWERPFFTFFPNALELAVPPLFFFYVFSLIHPEQKFRIPRWAHFIPFFLAQAYAFVIYFLTFRMTDIVAKRALSDSLYFDEIKQGEEYLMTAIWAIYIVVGNREIKAYRKWQRETTSDNTSPDFSWITTLFWFLIVIGGIKLGNHLGDIAFGWEHRTIIHWHTLNLILVGVIYFIGLKGYLLPHYSFSREEFKIEAAVDKPPDVRREETMARLQRAMIEEKLFLRPKLSLKELASLVEIPQRDISQAINQQHQLSFREFVNQYRVEEVKLRLQDPNYAHMSILGIGLDCGFSSEASFYRVFKQHTGMSPKGFMKDIEIVGG